MTTLIQFSDFVDLLNKTQAGTSYNLNNRVYARVPMNLAVERFIQLETAPLEVHDLKSSSVVDRILQTVSHLGGDHALYLEAKGIEHWAVLHGGYIDFEARSTDLPPMINDAKQGLIAEPHQFLEQFLLQPGNRVLISGSGNEQDCFFIDSDRGQWIRTLSSTLIGEGLVGYCTI